MGGARGRSPLKIQVNKKYIPPPVPQGFGLDLVTHTGGGRGWAAPNYGGGPVRRRSDRRSIALPAQAAFDPGLLLSRPRCQQGRGDPLHTSQPFEKGWRKLLASLFLTFFSSGAIMCFLTWRTPGKCSPGQSAVQREEERA